MQETDNLKIGKTYRDVKTGNTVKLISIHEGMARWLHVGGNLIDGQEDGNTPIKTFENRYTLEEKVA